MAMRPIIFVMPHSPSLYALRDDGPVKDTAASVGDGEDLVTFNMEELHM